MGIRTLFRIAGVVASGVLMYRLIVLPAQCNRTIAAVERSTRAALYTLPPLEAARTARENLAALNDVAGGCSGDFDLYLLLAFNKNILGRSEEAVADLTRALLIADRPEIYLDRGLIQMELGRVDAAVEDLRTAVAFSPHLLDQLSGELRARVEAAVRTPGGT